MSDSYGSWEFNSELQAVNDVMAAIGEAPVQTLEGDTNIDVVNARRLLHTINRQIQSIGYSFNIEEGTELVPDVFSKLIVYQPSWLKVLNGTTASTMTNRGGYLYDQATRTDQFDSPVQVNTIILRPFDELPVPFQTWIVAKAAKVFNSRFFGEQALTADLSEAEAEARMYAMEYELDYSAINAFQNDQFLAGAIAR